MSTTTPSNDVLKEYILSMVEVKPSGCWEWQGNIQTDDGYGRVYMFGLPGTKAHRLSYSLFVDEIQDGLCILHKCDNRKCVNPDHLWAGTRLENNNDMARKSRAYRGFGEEAQASKLTEATVKNIRMLYSIGVPVRRLSMMFSTSRSNVYAIINRETWACV